MDEILRRAFASRNTELSSEFDISNPNIRDFNRFQTPRVDDSIPDPYFYLLADCSSTSIVVSQVDTNDTNVTEQDAADLVANFQEALSTLTLLQIMAMTDVFILIVLIIGFNVIQKMQKDFTDTFKLQ